jgi:hypothetical protein
LAQKYTTHVIRGELNWAKVLGAPVMNEFAKERQWSVDVTPNAAGLAELKRLKLNGKLKNKGKGDFISFRQSEFKKNGEPNDPIQITDAQGNLWPANKKIGNGSVGDVKFSYTDFGSTKGNYIKAIRILQHVPYVQQEFAPLSEDDEFFAGEGNDAPIAGDTNPASDGAEASPRVDENLDDDVPF